MKNAAGEEFTRWDALAWADRKCSNCFGLGMVSDHGNSSVCDCVMRPSAEEKARIDAFMDETESRIKERLG